MKNTPVKIYRLGIHITASDDTHSGSLAWDGYVDESCSRHADVRDHRETLLRAVIAMAEAELEKLT